MSDLEAALVFFVLKPHPSENPLCAAFLFKGKNLMFFRWGFRSRGRRTAVITDVGRRRYFPAWKNAQINFKAQQNKA